MPTKLVTEGFYNTELVDGIKKLVFYIASLKPGGTGGPYET